MITTSQRWALVLIGTVLIGIPVALGFVRVTEDTYQHIRIWSHALLGLSIGLGMMSIAAGIRGRRD